MRVLAAAGADPKAVMPDGTTALMLAAGNGESRARDERRNETRRQICVCDWGVMEDERVVLEAVTVALSLGSDVDTVNKAGETALHSAASMRYDTVVQLLAGKGADPNVRNKRGQTPLAAVTGSGGSRAAADGDPYGEQVAKYGGAAAQIGRGRVTNLSNPFCGLKGADEHGEKTGRVGERARCACGGVCPASCAGPKRNRRDPCGTRAVRYYRASRSRPPVRSSSKKYGQPSPRVTGLTPF